MTPGPTFIYQCSHCSGLFCRYTVGSGNTLYARYRSDGKFDAPMWPTSPPLVACPTCRDMELLRDSQPIDQYQRHRGVFRNPSPKEARYQLEQEAVVHKYRQTLRYGVLTAEECLAFVGAGVAGADEELDLRIYTLQRVNDERLRGRDAELWAYDLQRIKALRRAGNKAAGWRRFATHGRDRRTRRPPHLDLEGALNSGIKCAPLSQMQAENHAVAIDLLARKITESYVLLRAELLRELGRFEEALALLDRELQNDAIAEQLWQACEAGCVDPFTFVDGEDAERFAVEWQRRRSQASRSTGMNVSLRTKVQFPHPPPFTKG